MPELQSMLRTLGLFSLMAYPSNEDSQGKFMANKVAKIRKEWPELSEKHIVQGKKPKDWSQEKWEELARKWVQLGRTPARAVSPSRFCQLPIVRLS